MLIHQFYLKLFLKKKKKSQHWSLLLVTTMNVEEGVEKRGHRLCHLLEAQGQTGWVRDPGGETGAEQQGEHLGMGREAGGPNQQITRGWGTVKLLL